MSWVSQHMRSDERRSIEHFFGGVTGQKQTSRKRGYTGVFTLIAGGFLVYTSLPYASAFFDVSKIVGVSEIDRRVDVITETVIRREYYKKIYLRAGQSLTAEYTLPQGAELVLEIRQCQARPVFEVFQCKPIAAQTVGVVKPQIGTYTVTVDQPGFYNFGDALLPSADGPMKYKLLWRRG